MIEVGNYYKVQNDTCDKMIRQMFGKWQYLECMDGTMEIWKDMEENDEDVELFVTEYGVKI